MPRETLEQEIDRVEVELSSAVDSESRAEPLIRRRIGGEEVFVPRTTYRFNYRNPERLTTDEARRRRIESALQDARRASAIPPVSGRERSQSAFKRSEASASDARRFHPSQRFFVNPRTLFGTEAYTFVSAGLKHHFRTPVLAIPCIQRFVRREVMFAKRKAGRGYRVPHVRSLLSAIGC